MPTTEQETKRPFLCKLADDTSALLTVRHPNYAEREAADMEYSKVFNKCVRNGIVPRTTLHRDLVAQNIWSDKQDEHVEELRREALTISEKLTETNWDGKDAEKAACEKAREDALQAFSEARRDLESMLQHTADGKADFASRNVLMACTLEYAAHDEDGKPTGHPRAGKRVWDSVEAFMEEQDGSLIARCMHEYTMFNAGLPSEWEDQLAATEDESENNEAPDTDTKDASEGEQVKGDTGEAQLPAPPAPDAPAVPEVPQAPTAA